AQFLPHFGKSTGFLLLENVKGEKMALLPVWNPLYENDLEKEQSLHFPYAYDFQDRKVTHGHVVSFDVTEFSLVPKDLEARYYLAKIYLEKSRIDEAEELLFSTAAESTSRKLDERERARLQSLIQEPYSKNIGSRTIKARVRALYLLEKNAVQFQS